MRFAIAIVAVLFSALPSRAETCAYLMRGYLFGDSGMQMLAAKLRAGGVTVRGVGDWSDANRFEADALAHPGCQPVLIGHSRGVEAAADVANDLAAHGIHARVIGIDKLLTGAIAAPGVKAVHFYGGALPMSGARNISLGAYGDSHLGMLYDPRVQRLVVAATK